MKSIFSNRKKRSREEIVASILEAAKYGATKTRIMYVSFSSFSQLQRYLGIALESGLIGLDPNTGKYFITSKGLEYLKRFEEVQSIENNVVEKRKSLSEILESKDS
jgi:predicted transcriptional regulator